MRPHIHKLLDQIGIRKFLAKLAERADLNSISSIFVREEITLNRLLVLTGYIPEVKLNYQK